MMLRVLFVFMFFAVMCPEAAQAQLRGHGGPVRALAISPDGTQALSGSFDTSAIRWSLQRNAAEQVLRFHDGAVNAVAFLPDGRIATSGEDARIAIWRAGELQPAMVLEGHKAPVVALAVSPDGAMLASASWDHTARLWPLAGGAPRVIEGHTQNVNGVAFTPDGRALVTAGYDATLRISPLVVRRRWRADRRRRCRRRSTQLRSRPTARSSPPAPTARFMCLRPRASCKGEIEAAPDADHRGGAVGRRQAHRRRRHPRLGRHHRSRVAHARAHPGRAGAAGLVGRILSRQPHAAHRRHRPHDPPLGRGQRRTDRRRGHGHARRTRLPPSPAIPAPRCFAPASPVTP